MDRAGRGEREAFRTLFDRYHERVHRYALARVAGPEEAQDVVQEVFLAAWRGLPRFRYEHEGSFPAWLFGIARNVVGTHRRRSLRDLALPADRMPDGDVEFEGRLLSRQVLLQALARLPELQREVLLLRFWTGLSLREVAEVVGRSERAVSTLQLRALKRLGRAIEEGT